ncbi:hypothetical protein E2L06_10655 [Haloterrigena sp. H1]|uniref:hypothetical protein n=1 Tax=Haloterrigena sp. H1 TaxID=2552943 RepID=UPI00110F1315|nr:hypothetical protein [Haloterrigena sp. H1]TMT87022.1 hypothetical protein E2L06_10655 [Haloterrigena sp. H1]
MVDIELDLGDDVILVEDHDRQQLIATKSGNFWRILEGPIDESKRLANRTTVDTPTQALVDTLPWLAEDE